MLQFLYRKISSSKNNVQRFTSNLCNKHVHNANTSSPRHWLAKKQAITAKDLSPIVVANGSNYTVYKGDRDRDPIIGQRIM